MYVVSAVVVYVFSPSVIYVLCRSSCPYVFLYVYICVM